MKVDSRALRSHEFLGSSSCAERRLELSRCREVSRAIGCFCPRARTLLKSVEAISTGAEDFVDAIARELREEGCDNHRGEHGIG
jgi:hypothetical protein